MNWKSTLETDYDLDGCKDTGEVNSGFGEDEDDDNDGVVDDMDDCDPESGFPNPKKNWESNLATNDVDTDGCHDSDEDVDRMETQKANEIKQDADDNRNYWVLVAFAAFSVFAFAIVGTIRATKGGNKTTVITGDVDGPIVVDVDNSEKKLDKSVKSLTNNQPASSQPEISPELDQARGQAVVISEDTALAEE